MDWEYYIGKLWFKIIYFFSVIVYLVKLNKLNKELLARKFDSSFSLLAYKDYVPLGYFFIALVLFCIGCYLIYWEAKKLKIGVESFSEIVIAFVTIIVIIILLGMIIVDINNPIMRAVLISLIAIVGGAFVVSN